MRDRGIPILTAVALAAVLTTAWADDPSPAEEVAPAVTPTPPPVVEEPAPNAQPPKDEGGFITRRLRALFSDHEPGEPGVHWGPFFPSVSNASTGSGPGPMLHFWLPDIGGSKLDLHASAIYSIFQYQYYDFQFGLLPHHGQQPPSFSTGTDNLYPLGDLYKTAGMIKFNLYANVRHRIYPREAFYGLGPDTPETARSDYALHDTLAEVVTEFRPASWLTLSLRAGFLRTNLSAGKDHSFPDTKTVFTDESAPALFKQPDYLTASFGLLIDTRDERGNPHRGGTIAVAISRYDDRGAGGYQFTRVVAGAIRFKRLGSNRHVVVARAVTSLDQTSAGNRVPFYLQSALGGSNFLRGFESFRFRGSNLIIFSGEYRFEVVPKVEIALFYDAGKVFQDRQDFDFNGLETTWGAGLRLKSLKHVRLLLDVGRSREHVKAIVRFSPS